MTGKRSSGSRFTPLFRKVLRPFDPVSAGQGEMIPGSVNTDGHQFFTLAIPNIENEQTPPYSIGGFDPFDTLIQPNTDPQELDMLMGTGAVSYAYNSDLDGFERIGSRFEALHVSQKATEAQPFSGTIDTGGVSQLAIAANTDRSEAWIANPSDTLYLYINIDGDPAGPNLPGSIAIPPLLGWAGNVTNDIQIYGATTGQAYTAGERYA